MNQVDSKSFNPTAFLQELFATAISASHPAQTLSKHLPKDTRGSVTVIGAGKAAAAMALTLEQHWKGPITGLVVVPYGHGEACQYVEVIEAAHPVPDEMGVQVSHKIALLTQKLSADDIVICLLSGGGSALLPLPAVGISFQDKQSINTALLRCGAAIDEINCVRKHLSAIKGGRLAQMCAPATIHTYAISDVPGDDPSVIASGPTSPDSTTSEQALAILEKYVITIPKSVREWLNNPHSETPKPHDLAKYNNQFTLISTPQQALNAAASKAQTYGITPWILSDCVEGEAKEVAKVHAAIVQQIANHTQPIKPPCVIISGGETSVTLKGSGRGGRNSEFLLSFILSLTKQPQTQRQVYAIAADTDGIDGSEHNAGCLFQPSTMQQAHLKQLNLGEYLANNDGYSFFELTDDLIITGPTRTNVNDFRAILIY
ncbi:glycerate kinase [Psychrobium sp. 1_MG-2023]|uniref:glycerate kinase type-2 family protein n=1 Tax=Psychrobium sp. 1_MG-2023 TaxID=3062624 RepID=UPI000C34116D|nr:glycerate kinase [Psychrobium sp. 1_MG-2023]MDP2559657.1 glycerate kinase [Psychrobium sp. 1_MG-2023]PKF59488.1 glycerate kinase [Alteromonadales bacterium alter-6D02]